MDAKDVSFDQDYCMYDVLISEQVDPVALELSDSLCAADEELTEGYKELIANFVNDSAKWFNIARNRILRDVEDADGLKLMTVYVLFEQEARSGLFGLLFNLNADREHGRGMKMDGTDYEIVAYGEAHVAFC